jgi:succinate dehydrogenase / fumarate reductase, cytochrome b subunit
MFSTSIGKKIWMAISGMMILLFVVLHLVGNSMNPYALGLPDLGKLMLVIKVVLLVLLLIHALLAIQVTIENRNATPKSYAVKKRNAGGATFSSETMIWTGLLILGFLIVHLLQFKFGILSAPGFDQLPFLGIYLVALVSLFMHLYHGIGSFFQTMGWNTACNKPAIETTGKIISLVLLAGFIAIVYLNK